MRLSEIRKHLKGRKIIGIRFNRFKTTRGNHPWTTDPVFELDNGTTVSFNVAETEGDYGIEVNVHEAQKGL